MSIKEFRKAAETSINQGNVTITFAQLAKAETMIIVTISYTIGNAKTYTMSSSTKATTIVSCFEAYDIYKSLNNKSHD